MAKELSAEQIVDRLIADGCQNEIFHSVNRKSLGNKFLDSLGDRNDVPRKWKNHEGNLARDVRIRGRELKFTDEESFNFAVENFFRSLDEDFWSRYEIGISQGGRSGGWLEISAEDVGTLIRKDAKDGKIVVEDEKSFRAALLKFVEEMMDWYADELAGERKFDAIGEGIYDSFVDQLYFDMEDRELYEDIDFSWFGFPTVESVMNEINSAIESTLDDWERSDPFVDESRRLRRGRLLREARRKDGRNNNWIIRSLPVARDVAGNIDKPADVRYVGELSSPDRASFYGKAKLYFDDEGNEYLKSYDTFVAKKTPEGETFLLIDPVDDDWAFTATTARHIKAFARNEEKREELVLRIDRRKERGYHLK